MFLIYHITFKCSLDLFYFLPWSPHLLTICVVPPSPSDGIIYPISTCPDRLFIPTSLHFLNWFGYGPNFVSVVDLISGVRPRTGQGLHRSSRLTDLTYPLFFLETPCPPVPTTPCPTCDVLKLIVVLD